jgi:hypothetical protein
MVGSGPGGLLYPYVVRGYRKSTSPAQEELFGHRRGRLGRQVVGLPLEQTELEAGDRRVDPFHRRREIENPPGWLQEVRPDRGRTQGRCVEGRVPGMMPQIGSSWISFHTPA